MHVQSRQIAAFGAEPLRVIIQVRQIDERQIRLLRAQNLRRAAGNPLRACIPRRASKDSPRWRVGLTTTGGQRDDGTEKRRRIGRSSFS